MTIHRISGAAAACQEHSHNAHIADVATDDLANEREVQIQFLRRRR